LTKNKYLLLDGNNLSHIAFHRAKSIILKIKKKTDPNAELVASDYSDVESMMYNTFFMKFHKHLRKFKGYYFIFCWDNFGSSEWRRAIYDQYKVRRDYDKDPVWKILFDGIAKLQSVLRSYPVYQITVEKLEADDIMFTLSDKLRTYGDVTILSGDSDMIQAVQLFGIKLYHPIKDKYIKCPETYDYTLFKAIMGDHTDDIEGVYGYGPVKSAKLAEAVENDPNAINKLDKDQQDIVKRNQRLIDIRNNPNLCKVNLDITSIHSSTNVDTSKIQKFYFDNKLKILIEDFDSVISLFA
jgi:5'-3' exonuclease